MKLSTNFIFTCTSRRHAVIAPCRSHHHLRCSAFSVSSRLTAALDEVAIFILATQHHTHLGVRRYPAHASNKMPKSQILAGREGDARLVWYR
jgi:hypothetical protein